MYGIFLKHQHKSGTGVPALAESIISDEHEGPWASTHVFMYLKTSPKKLNRNYQYLQSPKVAYKADVATLVSCNVC